MLLELQRAFFAALDSDGGVPPLFKGTLARDGFAAYRNNWLEGTRKALASDYPVVARLVGADCFAALARAYRRAHPSRSGNLENFSAGFSVFLDSCYADTAHAYLADVARLERAIDDCLLAASARPITIDLLASLRDSELAGLRLHVHPASRLLRSPWPVVAVWEMHQDPHEPEPIDLAAGGADVLVQRAESGVQMRMLDGPSFDLLQRIASGMPLASACHGIFHDHDTSAAGQTLARLFAWGCFCGLDLDSSSAS